MAFASVYTMGDVAMEMLHVCEDQKYMGTLAFFSFATYLKTELLTFLQSSMLWALLLSVEAMGAWHLNSKHHGDKDVCLYSYSHVRRI